MTSILVCFLHFFPPYCRHDMTWSVDVVGFKSKKIRVNLNLPIKAETKAESTDVLKTVDEDRKYVIQATIVR